MKYNKNKVVISIISIFILCISVFLTLPNTVYGACEFKTESNCQKEHGVSGCYKNPTTNCWEKKPTGSCEFKTESKCEKEHGTNNCYKNTTTGCWQKKVEVESDDETTTQTFSAKFDANSGNLIGDSDTVKCTTTKGKDSCTITNLPTAKREGYIFNGWNTTKTCPTGNKTRLELKANTIYYACWMKGTSGNTGTSNSECSEECNDLAPAVRIIKYGLVPMLQIGVPIVLILMGMLDFGKAVMSGKEDEMKKHQSLFVKRCIYAIAVFLVMAIVSLAFNLFAISGIDDEVEGTTDWIDCYNAVGIGEDNKCEN